jgi:hypothetical protein
MVANNVLKTANGDFAPIQAGRLPVSVIQFKRRNYGDLT